MVVHTRGRSLADAILARNGLPKAPTGGAMTL
jgi:hypothetical protein